MMLPLIFLIFLASAEANLQLTSTDVLRPDDPLTITCNFTLTDHPRLASITSLTLSKKNAKSDNQFINLIAITSSNPNTVNPSDEFLGSSSGSAPKEGPEAYLRAEYLYSKHAEGGEYKCEVHGIDKSGFDATISNSAYLDIGGDEDGDSASKDKIRIQVLEKELKDAKEKLSHCGEGADLWFQVANRWAIKAGHDKESEVRGTTRIFTKNVGLSNSNSSLSFYVITDKTETFSESNSLCQEYGGYLAEINTKEEFDFIQSEIERIFGGHHLAKRLLTGLSYKNGQPDTFHTHPADQIYAGPQRHGDKDEHEGSHNGWVALTFHDNKMSLTITHRDDKERGALCEVTLASK